MTTAAKTSNNVTLRYKAGAVVIGEVTNIQPPKQSRSTKDVSNSGSGTHQEKIPVGLIDGGDVQFTCNWLKSDAGQVALRTGIKNVTAPDTFEIVHPDASIGVICEFDAWVTEIGPTIGGQNDSLECSFTLSVTGEPKYFAVAAAGLTTPFFAVTTSTGIIPAPAGAVYEYIVNIATATASVTITPTATAGTITIRKSDGTILAVVPTGTASPAITLGAAGSITTVTVEVSESGKSTKIYNLHLARA